jgi:DNA recombination protein Rad52
MNAIFGHGGWSSQITMERNILNEKDERGRWNVGYLTSVRVTLLNGASHEDCGSGEGIDNSKIKAHEKAIKSAITDGMKRAARHFGERLGNALYVKGCGIKTAPKTNRDALLELERKDSLNLFGDQAVLRENHLRSPVENPSSDKVIAATTPSIAVVASTNQVNNENWQQIRVGQTYNNRPTSNNGDGVQQQQTGSAKLPVLSSPIPSSALTHGSLMHSYVASHPYQVNNFMPQTSLTNIAVREPIVMAPPPRPTYNPLGGGTAGRNMNDNEKRGVDGIENRNPGNSYINGHTITGENTKRLKVNPYSSRLESSSRLSMWCGMNMAS